MKKILILVFVLIAQPLFSSPKILMLGSDPNYVGTALEQIGGKSMSFSVGGFTADQSHGIFGWYLREYDLAGWPTLSDLVFFRLKMVLQSDGWKGIGGAPMQPQEKVEPRYLFVTGNRKGEMLEVLVTLIPEEGGKIAVTFSQRWSPKIEASKESVPTAPGSHGTP